MIRLAAAILLCCFGCSDPPQPPKPAFDAARPKRVFEPPPGEVRPVPPFAIRSDGIGPYLLGADLKEVLDILPRGPRIEMLTIVGVAEIDLVRSEAGALLIGSQRKVVRFVAVVEPEIAKTASGIGVGATEAELSEAFKQAGATLARRAEDPRVREFSTLPGVRFIVDRGRVVAVMVAPREEGGEPDPPGTAECRSGGELAEAHDGAGEAAKLKGAPAGVVFGCFTGAEPEALVFDGERLAIVGGSPDKLKRLAAHRVHNLRYAAPIDIEGDGRDEVAVVAIERGKRKLTVRVELMQWDGSKLVSVRSQTAYVITQKSAALAGASLDTVDLLIELSAGERALELGGVYLHRVHGRTREVAPLRSRTMRLRKERAK